MSEKKPSDEWISKTKEDFIKYLEEHDVVNHLSKALLELFNEKDKPENAIKYIRDHLYNSSDVSLEELIDENVLLRQENEKLTKKLEELNETLKGLISAIPKASLQKSD